MRDGDRSWSDLIGASEAEVRGRFGEPVVRRAAAGELWLVFETPPGRLRMRCRDDGTSPPRVASWTVTFAPPHDSLAEAARAVGLWPAAGPDVAAGDVDRPLVRRPLRVMTRDDGDGGGDADGVLSLTATIREGRFDRLSVFDEPPDWL
ncbi:MAG TPA: hypothetical protein VLA33_13035 [Gemmatimonadota bacterium]|nr:hypothetical protein [Gemmatimonadota bacterium]